MTTIASTFIRSTFSTTYYRRITTRRRWFFIGGCSGLLLLLLICCYNNNSNVWNTFSTSRTKLSIPTWDYPLNISQLLEEAQIPPLHSPWHVLPKSWTTNTTRSAFKEAQQQHQQMLHDMKRFILEDGIISKNLVTKHRLYLIRQGTLLRLKHQPVENIHRWVQLEEMMQSALDIGRHILSRQETATNSTSSDAFVMSHHQVTLLKWLLGVDNDDDNNNKKKNIVPKTFPILVSNNDFRGCFSYSQTDTKYHIPWFTFAMESATKEKDNIPSAPITNSNCIPFALPCYDMWTFLNDGLKYSPHDWFFKSRKNYPGCQRNGFWDIHFDLIPDKFQWDNKVSKVIWRGSTTGAYAPLDLDDVESFSWNDIPRFQLVLQGLNHSDVMDFGFFQLIQGFEKEPLKTQILKELGPVKSRIKFTDFMKYQAILDINGNSWSSRFGHLMCLNSVVLKVETNDYINYFESPGGTNSSPELIPWKHYVPIHKNLSNLEEIARYVLDPNNVKQIQSIIQNANDWCQHKMTVTQFAIDVLWMLLNYIDLLYFGGSSSNSSSTSTMPQQQPQSYNFDDKNHPLNFPWMNRYVFRRQRKWERAIGTQKKTPFETQNVKVHNGSIYQY